MQIESPDFGDNDCAVSNKLSAKVGAKRLLSDISDPTEKKNKPKSKTANLKDILKNVPWAGPDIQKTFTGNQLQECADFSHEVGMGMLEVTLKPGFVDWFILSVAAIILNQPFKDEHKVIVQDDDDNVLTPENPGYLKLLKSNLSSKMRKVMRAGAALHVGFGAPCDVLIWHLACVWEIRQHTEIYTLATLVLGMKSLWIGLNRVIWKLPGEGDSEFLHWDSIVGTAAFEEKDKNYRKHCGGKWMATDTTFIFVPGSHKKKFHKKFQRLYFESVDGKPPLYNYNRAAKFTLDPSKPDPMNLFKRAVKVFVKRKTWVYWYELTLHGVIANPKDGKIAIGTYIGFFPAGSHPNYKKNSKVDELEDRLYSLKTGMPPKLYPSFDFVHKFPLQFVSFSAGLLSYIGKMIPGHASISTRVNETASKKAGIEVRVPTIINHISEADGYQPPDLSDLGRRLAGLDEWPKNE